MHFCLSFAVTACLYVYVYFFFLPTYLSVCLFAVSDTYFCSYVNLTLNFLPFFIFKEFF
jgi:hypothetical protein